MRKKNAIPNKVVTDREEAEGQREEQQETETIELGAIKTQSQKARNRFRERKIKTGSRCSEREIKL